MAKLSFTENEGPKGAFKASYVSSLFGFRKSLLDGTPMPSKGLTLPDLRLKIGKTDYTFKTDAVADKVSCKDKERGIDFCARYRKTSGHYDVMVKQTLCKGHTFLQKYEERGEGTPTYVVGHDMVYKDMKTNIKFNHSTGLAKFSGLYDLASIVDGMKLAADCKFNVNTNAAEACNVAVACCSSKYKLGLLVNQKGQVTLSKAMKMTDELTIAAELVQATSASNPVKNPATIAVAYECRYSDALYRARINKVGQLNLGLIKTIADNTKLHVGSVWNVFEPKTMLATPSFGFKIVVG